MELCGAEVDVVLRRARFCLSIMQRRIFDVLDGIRILRQCTVEGFLSGVSVVSIIMRVV